MRRSLICWAIVALVLGTQARAQETLPPGEPLLPGGQGALTPQPDPATGASETVWGQPQGYPAAADPAVQEAYGLGPCCERTGEGYCCPPDWYIDQRIRILYHPMPKGVPIGRHGEIVNLFWTGTEFEQGFRKRTVMSTRDARFEPSGGYEVTVGHYLGRDSDNRDQFVEFTYYGLHAWQAGAVGLATDSIRAVNGDLYPNSSQIPLGYTLVSGNLFSAWNNGITGFNRAERQEINYKSKWDNFELNLRIEPRQRRDRLILEPNGRWRREAQDDCRVAFLGGVRGISLDENFRFYSTGEIDLRVTSSGALVSQVDASGLYDVRTRNDMIGLQIGGEVTKRYGLATCGMRAKGAVFVNFADQFSHIKTVGSSGDWAATVGDLDLNALARSRGPAGLAEFGFIASYRLRENIIAHAAYDLMWVSGLALAPEQIQVGTAEPNRIDNGGVQMFQSVGLGLEVTW